MTPGEAVLKAMAAYGAALPPDQLNKWVAGLQKHGLITVELRKLGDCELPRYILTEAGSDYIKRKNL